MLVYTSNFRRNISRGSLPRDGSLHAVVVERPRTTDLKINIYARSVYYFPLPHFLSSDQEEEEEVRFTPKYLDKRLPIILVALEDLNSLTLPSYA